MGSWQGMGGMGWGWVFLAVLILGIVLLVLALVRGRTGGRRVSQPADRRPAREGLDERYARGDIDTAEYQDRLRQLGEHE